MPVSGADDKVVLDYGCGPGNDLVGYNGAITYDHSIDSGDKLQLPLGGIIGRTTDLGGGWGLDLNLGAYVYPIKPDGGPDWSFKFGISVLIPR